MDDLLTVAVAGTARAGVRSELPDGPIGQAIAHLDSAAPERWLLLAAGAYAIRRRAGVRPLMQPDEPVRADDETWSVAAERIALPLGELLSWQSSELLLEALERLQRARLLIPPALLPVVLDAGARNNAIRPTLLGVIGRRGRWLARQNSDWSWATMPDADDVVANADTIWQEGVHAERLDVLRLVRSSDPARGLALLASTWTRERAAFRAEAIELLGVNLSMEDQSFLEAALDDRATTVRERAEALLVRIPGSRPAREAEAQAEPLIGTRLGFQIVVRPPDDVEQATALIKAFSRVAPSHWTAHLGKRPSDLVKVIARDRDWGFSVLTGWTQATLTFEDEEWAAALFSVWLASPPPLGKAADAYARSFEVTVNGYLIGLLQVMRPADAERAVAASPDPLRMPAILRAAGRAWGAVFTDRYLRSLRDSVERTFRQAAVDSQAIHAWTASIQSATVAIPPGSIQDAIDLLHQVDEIELPGEAKFHGNYWKESLRRCSETLQMRQRIDEEIRA